MLFKSQSLVICWWQLPTSYPKLSPFLLLSLLLTLSILTAVRQFSQLWCAWESAEDCAAVEPLSQHIWSGEGPRFHLPDKGQECAYYWSKDDNCEYKALGNSLFSDRFCYPGSYCCAAFPNLPSAQQVEPVFGITTLLGK